jgi:hypothetical protein
MRDPIRQQLRRHAAAAGAHEAGGAHALLPQPQLGVEAVRVHRTVRLLQLHGQAPALAGAQRGGGRVVRLGGEPAERQALGQAHRHAIGQGRFDVEAELRAGGPCLRQRRDDAGHQQLAAFEAGVEPVRQLQRRAPAGAAESQQRQAKQQGGQQRDAAQPMPAATDRPCDQQQRARDHPRVVRLRPQPRLLQLQRHAREPGPSPRRDAPSLGGPRCRHRGPV